MPRHWVRDDGGAMHRCSSTLENLLAKLGLITRTADGSVRLMSGITWAGAKLLCRAKSQPVVEVHELNPHDYMDGPWIYPIGEQRTISRTIDATGE